MVRELAKFAKDNKVRYFLISFVDLFGTVRAKLVPAAAIGEMQKTGAGFAGFATWLDMTPADSDMFAVPDADSATVLPWKPDVAWVAGDLVMDGKAVDHAPRHVLKRQIARAAEMGYAMQSGVEAEYFMMSADGSALSDARDDQSKPCYDQQALMRRFDTITAICDAMGALGWEPYQNDHEDANGQFEMNWMYAPCLTTADRHVFFKYMVKTLAEAHGFRATFMPKPFSHLTGNGAHAHVSVWDTKLKSNLFHDPKGELGLSRLAYHFLGGVIHSAEALCALFNPTVNSYKRINAPPTLSGATWSPNTVTYGGNNRTHMVRIPEPGRFELRLADGAANPYLLQAGLLASGLDGIAHRRDPGKRVDLNMYTEGHTLKGARKLPLNLLDALRAFEASKILRGAFGDGFVDSYVKLKTADWNDHQRHLSEWERQQTLDC
jgi:glutamine synthetase